MNILALDLGTRTGFAYNRGTEFFCGTWNLATPKEIRQWGKDRLTRTADPRIERLCEHITSLGMFDVVVFEDVQFSTYTKQTQLWAGLRSSVWLCAEQPTRIECVPVSTLKKFATGSGAADKSSMSKFLKSRHPEIWGPNLDDNATDAAWAWSWAQSQFSRMKKI